MKRCAKMLSALEWMSQALEAQAARLAARAVAPTSRLKPS
jgi:hypothetical protein